MISSVYGSPGKCLSFPRDQRHTSELENKQGIQKCKASLTLMHNFGELIALCIEIFLLSVASSFVRSPLSSSSSCSWKHLLFDGRDDASFLLSRFSLFRLSYTAIQQRSWKTEYRPSLLVKHNKPFLWSTSWPLCSSTIAEKQEQKSYVPIYTCRNISK